MENLFIECTIFKVRDPSGSSEPGASHLASGLLCIMPGLIFARLGNLNLLYFVTGALHNLPREGIGWGSCCASSCYETKGYLA